MLMGVMESWVASLLQGVSLFGSGLGERGVLEVFKGKWGAGVGDYERLAHPVLPQACGQPAHGGAAENDSGGE